MQLARQSPSCRDPAAHGYRHHPCGCQLPFPDRSRALYGQVERDTRVRGCAARAAHVETEGLRYISNGYTLQGGMQDMYGTHVCPQFTNVVMLRWATVARR